MKIGSSAVLTIAPDSVTYIARRGSPTERSTAAEHIADDQQRQRRDDERV